MKLYVGGYAQGKLEYVSSIYQDYCVLDEKTISHKLEKNKKIKNIIFDIFKEVKNELIIINNLHLIIKEYAKNNYSDDLSKFEKIIEDDFAELIEYFSKECENLVIIGDEIGCGLVPVDKTERILRDITGHIFVETAKHSQEVYRIICGISQRIK